MVNIPKLHDTSRDQEKNKAIHLDQKEGAANHE